jgi:DNA-binding response OmpR family regulator
MAFKLSEPENVNVLISNANWAWPQAVMEIFQPRGINALVAESAGDMVRIVSNNKIHLAILDMTLEKLSGMQTLKIIRNHDKLLPCMLLAQDPSNRLLAQALSLNVFSVLAKPVDLKLLTAQIDRLFTKYYASNMFSCHCDHKKEIPGNRSQKVVIKQKKMTIFKWTFRKIERRNSEDENQTPGR